MLSLRAKTFAIFLGIAAFMFAFASMPYFIIRATGDDIGAWFFAIPTGFALFILLPGVIISLLQSDDTVPEENRADEKQSAVYNASEARCPNCGKYIGYSAPDFCPWCGSDISGKH